MLIDTHCHLNFKAFNQDYKLVYDQAVKAEVEKMVVVGTSLSSSQRAVEMAAELPGCFASVGIHPHHIKEFIDLGKDAIKERLEQLIGQKKIVAIGETGIDYYHYKNYPPVSEAIKEAQKELLTIHLELAQEFKKPVIFHCREAMDEMISYLLQLNIQLKWKPSGIFHCFSGTAKHLDKILDMGFYIGFDGNITYKENEELRKRVFETPLDRLLIETDSPYLTPEPHRGSRNTPAFVTIVAAWVAKIKNISENEVINQTTLNAEKLFAI